MPKKFFSEMFPEKTIPDVPAPAPAEISPVACSSILINISIYLSLISTISDLTFLNKFIPFSFSIDFL